MLYLSEIRDYVATLGIAADDHVYSGKLDDKKDKSIGVYNNKRGNPLKETIGGEQNESYCKKAVSTLVHWNKSQRETERAAYELYELLRRCRNAFIGTTKILFTKMNMNEPVDVGTDDNGIYEMVIEFDIYYER